MIQNYDVLVVVVMGVLCGVGKGIVWVFGVVGMIVYVMGCLQCEGDVLLFGMIYEIVCEIDVFGGCGIVVVCDYVDDVQVKVLFECVGCDGGWFDIFVNNVIYLYD